MAGLIALVSLSQFPPPASDNSTALRLSLIYSARPQHATAVPSLFSLPPSLSLTRYPHTTQAPHSHALVSPPPTAHSPSLSPNNQPVNLTTPASQPTSPSPYHHNHHQPYNHTFITFPFPLSYPVAYTHSLLIDTHYFIV